MPRFKEKEEKRTGSREAGNRYRENARGPEAPHQEAGGSIGNNEPHVDDCRVHRARGAEGCFGKLRRKALKEAPEPPGAEHGETGHQKDAPEPSGERDLRNQNLDQRFRTRRNGFLGLPDERG